MDKAKLLEIHTLGGVSLRLAGEPVTGLKSRKVEALLIYLACSERTHPREPLAELFWRKRTQAQAMSNLRGALASLRKQLGSYVTITRDTVALNPEARIWLDVAEFERHLDSGQLTEAVDLYQGDFVEGFHVRDARGFEDWALLQRERLRRLVLKALSDLVDQYTERGEYSVGLSYATRLLELDPLMESAHRQMMRVLAQSGQRAAALRQYDECVRVLSEELGAPPEKETTTLFQAIKAGREAPPSAEPEPERAPTLPPRLIVADRPRHNLPVQLTPFIGREALLTEIGDRLDDPDCRLLSLVGPGGCGKTRLALEIAAARIDDHEHGAFFVSLAPLESAEGMVPTVASALGFTFYQGPPPRQQLLDFLRGKNLLLVMDNFEHLLDGVHLVTDILRNAPGVKVLATSRANLNVQDEHRFAVAGMHYPDLESTDDVLGFSAVKLFVERARLTRQDFELTATNTADVARICRLVEGMPLGILLATAWLEMLTPEEIAQEIGQSLDFLETDLRDVPDRQRSMRVVFDHSWRLLSERERELMAAFSVFRGGFTRRAAGRVAGATLRDLKGFVDKSMLKRTATGRYELHELLRQYAGEKLQASPGATEAARHRHAAYYAGFLERRGEQLKGARQFEAVAEIEADIENARRAWDWATQQGQIDRLDQALEGLCLFYEWRGRNLDGEAACRGAAATVSPLKSDQHQRLLARLLAWLSAFGWSLSGISAASELATKSLSILDRLESTGQDLREEKAFALFRLGRGATYDDTARAQRLLDQSVALYQETGDRWGMARTLKFSADVAWIRGAYDIARQCSQQGLAIRRALGDRIGTAEALRGLGLATCRRFEDFEEGVQHLRQSLAICQEMGDPYGVAVALTFLGAGLLDVGEYAQARNEFEESIAVWVKLGMAVKLADSFLASAELHLGCYEKARTRGQTSLKTARETGDQQSIGMCLAVVGIEALTREAYAESEALLRESVSVFQALGHRSFLAFALPDLGYAARGLGKLSQAREHLCEGLRLAVDMGADFELIRTLPGIALLLADQGQVERAVELYALASRYPTVANSRWFEDVAGRYIADIGAENLSPDVVAAAQERGRARDLWSTVEELLQELEGEAGTAEPNAGERC